MKVFLRLLILMIFIIMTSCARKNINADIKVEWIGRKTENKILETEYYIYPNGDTLNNQKILKIDNVIDKTKSHYYELDYFESSDGKNFDGKIFYYSKLDTISNVVKRNVELSFLQGKGKQSDYSTFKINKKNNSFDFKYTDYDNNRLCGYIFEYIIVIDPLDPKKNKTIEAITLVDNKQTTYNPMKIN